MTDAKPPALFDWATELSDAQGHVTLSEQEAHEIGARLRRLHAENEALRAERERNLNSIRVNNEIINKKLDENEALQAGYAAARLEIESLRTRSTAPAGEYPELPGPVFESWAQGGLLREAGFTADQMRAYVDADRAMRAAQPAVAKQPGAAYAELPDDDRDYMRKVVAVAVTMLFDGYKEDVMRVFSTSELSEFVTITAAMRGEQVEDIYRRAWDLLSLPARASHGQAPAQAAPAAVHNDLRAAQPAHSYAAQTANCTYPACQIASGCGGTCGRQLAQAAPAAVAGPSELPTVPDSVLAYVHAYGDSRADDDGLSGLRVSELILALRRWAKSIAAAPTTQPAPPPSPASQRDALSQAASDVLAERQRQISAEGWTQSHDDLELGPGQLSSAAACYALNASAWLERPYVSRADYATLGFINLSNWPWDRSRWKPKNERGDLVRAGALIIAELERMDRADAARAAQEGKSHDN